MMHGVTPAHHMLRFSLTVLRNRLIPPSCKGHRSNACTTLNSRASRVFRLTGELATERALRPNGENLEKPQQGRPYLFCDGNPVCLCNNMPRPANSWVRHP